MKATGPTRRLLLLATAAVIVIAGMAMIPQGQNSSRNQESGFNLPPPADVQAVLDYLDRVETICTAAHARLHIELQASGIDLDSDDPSILKAKQRIMGETLAELRAVPSPAEIQERFEHLYGLMEQFADGEEMPYTSDREFWVHQLTREPSLFECTFDLPG